MLTTAAEEEKVADAGRDPTVVVGVDGSPEAPEAARWAADEAIRRHCRLRLVHAFGRTPEPVVGRPGLGEQRRDVLLEQARRGLDAAVAAVARHAPDLPVEHGLVWC